MPQQRDRGILVRSQDPSLGEKSVWSIKWNKVPIMMIIPQSMTVSLPIHVLKCDMTANEVFLNGYRNWFKPYCNHHMIYAKWRNTMYTTHSCLVVSLTLAPLFLINQYVRDFAFELTAIVKTFLLVCKGLSYFVNQSWFLDDFFVPRSLIGVSINNWCLEHFGPLINSYLDRGPSSAYLGNPNVMWMSSTLKLAEVIWVICNLLRKRTDHI